ncbi:MAG: SDR family NAD(P)-dependent oxidoreductase [Spirochaetales bacterium]
MTWLVTGASSGVGRVLAVALSGAGHRVLLTGRNKAWLADTQRWCLGSEAHAADLADPASVDQLEAWVRDQVGHGSTSQGLAGIVHAAGLMAWDSPATASGWSLIPAVNAVAPWRLTRKLEDLLLVSEHPRVLFIAGAAFTLKGVLPHLENWKGEQKGRGLALALEAASAKVWMARELHRRWAGKGSTFAFHPGFIKSHLADGLPFPLSFLGCLAQPFLAARCFNGEFLALDPAAPLLSGNLVEGRKAKPECPDGPGSEAQASFLSSWISELD